MNTLFRKVLVSLGCASVLCVTAVAPAQAAIIVGSFDPAFNLKFVGLGWSGKIEFRVDDACLSGTPAACNTAEMRSASVDLYKLTDSGGRDYDAPTDRLNFMSSTLRMDIRDITVSGGNVTGLETGLEALYKIPEYNWQARKWTFKEYWLPALPSLWASPSGALMESLGVGYTNYDYGLFMTGGVATLVANSNTVSRVNRKWVDTTFGCPVSFGFAMCTSGDNPEEIDPPKIAFARFDDPTNDIPEPGSAALMLGALGAAAWVCRRKSRLN
jgi:hypothetical protein